jgi:hypothetical protein
MKIIKHFRAYFHNNPTVAYGWLTILTTYIVKKFPDIPNDLILLTLMTLFGLSIKVQKIEDNKIKDALYKEPPK